MPKVPYLKTNHELRQAITHILKKPPHLHPLLFDACLPSGGEREVPGPVEVLRGMVYCYEAKSCFRSKTGQFYSACDQVLRAYLGW